MKARLCDRQRNIAESENLTTHLPLLERGLSDEVVLNVYHGPMHPIR